MVVVASSTLFKRLIGGLSIEQMPKRFRRAPSQISERSFAFSLAQDAHDDVKAQT